MMGMKRKLGDCERRGRWIKKGGRKGLGRDRKKRKSVDKNV